MERTLPWRVSGNAILDKYNYSVALTGKEDAEYIVKCCNMFPEMVTLLEKYEEEWRTGYEINFGSTPPPEDEKGYWEIKNLLDRAKEDNNAKI